MWQAVRVINWCSNVESIHLLRIDFATSREFVLNPRQMTFFLQSTKEAKDNNCFDLFFSGNKCHCFGPSPWIFPEAT